MDSNSIHYRQRVFRNVVLLFAVTALIRLGFFLIFFRSISVQQTWGTGFEACHIAASLVSGQGFSSPFGVPTGSTAWVPPIYTGIVAIAFKFFGSYSSAAAWFLLMLNAIFAGFTSVAIYLAGREFFGGSVGILSAWIWAFSAYAVLMTIKIWETSLSALLVAVSCVLYGRLRDSDRLQTWILWGVFWAFAVLVNPTLGIFIPFLTLAARCQPNSHRCLKVAMLSRLAIGTLAFSLIVGPWIARNYVRFHAFIPVRSNFGVELWLGNHQGVVRPNDETHHPLGDPNELATYAALGERAYTKERLQKAMAFISVQPAEFWRLTARRVAYFWTSPHGSFWILISVPAFLGLVFSMRKDFLQSIPLAVAMLLYPVPYYLTHADNWYRHPIEPVMTLLAVNAFNIRKAFRSRGSDTTQVP